MKARLAVPRARLWAGELLWGSTKLPLPVEGGGSGRENHGLEQRKGASGLSPPHQKLPPLRADAKGCQEQCLCTIHPQK